MWLRLLSAVLLFVIYAGHASAFRIAVISDMNGSYGSVAYDREVHDAVREIIRLKPDVVISNGDMVAGQRRPLLSAEDVNAMWRAFHEAVSDPFQQAGIPFLVTPGNHDASGYSGFEGEREIFRQQWAPRAPDGVDHDWPFAYAWERNGVRLISLDATTIGRLPTSQIEWLMGLGRSAGSTIVFSHLPLHPFAQDRRDDLIIDPALSRTLEQIGVDVHLSGHHHAYYPGSDGKIAYVSQACLGGGPRTLIGASEKSPKGFTLLEIEDGRIVVMALTPDASQTIPLESLPDRVGELTRLDLLPTPSVLAAD